MKRWVGGWLIGVAAVHTIVAIVVFGEVFASVVRRGVFNTVGTDPMVGGVVWFVLFGAVLFICGQAIAALEKALSGQLPKSIGWSLLALGTIGVTLMPLSGFWLVFPPAIAVLIRRGC